MAARRKGRGGKGLWKSTTDGVSWSIDCRVYLCVLCTKVTSGGSDPLHGGSGDLEEVCLAGAGVGLVVVEPGGGLGHGHEDALDTGARGLETELGASVVDQVELDVAASADLLPLLLLGGVGGVLASSDEREVGGEHGVEAALGHLEAALGRETVEVVVEDAADATGLAAVRDVEVAVAPGLELRVEVCAEGVERLLVLQVEVAGVLGVEVAGREVCAAAKPPRLRRAVRVDDLEVAVVQVHRGRVRVPRVQHHAQPAREEAHRAGCRRLDVLVVVLHPLDGPRRQRAVHNRHVHPGLLERRPVRKHHRPPAPAVVAADPLVRRKLLGLQRLQPGTDLRLLLTDETLHLLLDRQRGVQHGLSCLSRRRRLSVTH